MRVRFAVPSSRFSLSEELRGRKRLVAEEWLVAEWLDVE